MKRSPYQQQKAEKLRQRTIALYKEGLTTRDVGKIIGRSHQWVADAVKESVKKEGKIRK